MANFTVSTTFCAQEKLDIVNGSVNADSYAWDFCPQDFMDYKNTTDAAFIPSLTGGYGYKLVKSSGMWYGFVSSRDNHKLFRLEYGDDPNNSPTIIDLGNPGGKLVFPEGIDITQVNGNWFGFVGSLDFSSPTQGVIRLDFGSSLQNVPIASNLGNFGYSTRFRDLKIIKQGSDLILLLVNYNENSIVRINYGNDFNNPVNGLNIIDSGPIPGISLPVGVDCVTVNSNWIVMLTSLANSRIVQLNLGSDILSSPSTEASYSFSGVSNPYKVKLIQEADKYFAIVSNESQPVVIIDFNDLNPINIPVELDHVGLPALLGIESLRYQGVSLILGVGIVDNKLKKIVFESNCGANLNFSSNKSPVGISYSSAGAKKIELAATNVSLNITSITSASITVSSSSAPDISLSSQNVCANNDVNFTSQNTSGGITDYNWDFGDASSAMIANPTHQYTDAGDYDVSLQVTASNGCNNLARETITIYDEPTADFNLPAASPICTNQDYLLTNTSTFDSGSNPSWQWEVNGSPVSSDQDLTYSIPSASQQDIKLIASISGCSTEITKSILTVEDGPLADFTYANGCEDSSIAFTNTTSGTVTSYTWNFGDGNSSGQTNGSNTYVDFGNYDVTLSATNAAGCNNSVVKPIQIYSKPQPNFSLDLPPFSCNGSPSQFNDLTPNPTDSNLTGWNWSFGDGSGGTSISRNPQYTYALAGQYDVNLQATTNFGCTATTQKQITISQSPTTDFSFNAPCVNQATVFVDESGPSISSWQWKIGSSTYTQQNPTHVFSFPSTYNAMLTVTGANGCIGLKSKSVAVPTAPGLDFATENNCSGQNTIFTDASTLSTDLPVSWQWQFGTLGSGTGASTQFAFPSPGSYPAKLTVMNQSGCTYSFSKSITIAESPKANFIPTPQSGTPPLVVSFSNTSTNATSQSWFVNNSGTPASAALSPTLTFDALGDYVVDLMAVNAAGCSDTFSQIISVVVPSLDVALANLTLIPTTTGEVTVLVSLVNNSNSSVKNPKVLLDITGETIISEILPITLLPGQSYSQALTTGVLATKAQLDYLCAQVVVDGDINPANDKKCTNLESEAFIFDPYPNPASDHITIEWVAADVNNAAVVIFNSTGSAVFENEFTGQPAGLNQLTINLESLNSGAYFMRFTTGNTHKSFRFVIRE